MCGRIRVLQVEAQPPGLAGQRDITQAGWEIRGGDGGSQTRSCVCLSAGAEWPTATQDQDRERGFVSGGGYQSTLALQWP